MTAAIGLYTHLALPPPWQPTTVRTPLIVYGASSAVGAFAIKLASVSNVHPIIAVAGAGQAYVEKLIDRSKGDTIVDYRDGNEAVISGIKEAVKKAGLSEIKLAYDAVSEKNSYQNICGALAKGGKITLVLPGKKYPEIPADIVQSITSVGSVHREIDPKSEEGKTGIKTGSKEFGYVFFRLFGKGLQEGWFTPHPHQIVPGGLSGLEYGLKQLKAGKVSATKLVYRIDETSKL
jgi:NADPH2:quinone reductase